eukprot:8178361-Prorocentrum_lima.AAC.1
MRAAASTESGLPPKLGVGSPSSTNRARTSVARASEACSKMSMVLARAAKRGCTRSGECCESPAETGG